MMRQLLLTLSLALLGTVAMAQPASAFCETPAQHFDVNTPGSGILLTIANIDANTMYVEIESTEGGAVSQLLVNGGSGAQISNANTGVPGKISKFLTWPGTPPADVFMEILWGKEGFPGLWLLQPGGNTYPFNAVCDGLAPPPPIVNPTFCQTPVTHFAGDPPSEILLTVTNIDPNTIFVEIESTDGNAVNFMQLQTATPGGAISPPDFSVPGKISQTLSYASPPAEVNINLLWGKENFGGQWLLGTSPTTVSFAVNCDALAIPTMGQWGLFYLALLILILGVVGVTATKTAMQLSTTEGSRSASFSLTQFPFEKGAFFAAFKMVLLFVPLAFAFIYVVWGEIIFDDIVGMALAIPMVAYLVYLVKRS